MCLFTGSFNLQAALTESSRKSRDEKVHEIFDRFDEDYDMVLNASEYGNLLATVDPDCDGKPVEEIQDLAADDFERYNDAITDDGLTEVGLRMLVDYKGLDVDKAYLNLLVRQSEVRLDVYRDVDRLCINTFTTSLKLTKMLSLVFYLFYHL